MNTNIQETVVFSGYFGVALVMEAQEFECFKKKYQEIHGAKDLDEYIQDKMLDEYHFLPSDKTTQYFAIQPITTEDYEGVDLYPYFDMDGKANWCHKRQGDRIVKNPNWRDSKCWAEPELYAVFANKEMQDVLIGDEKPYTSREELLKEFQDKLSGYLPAEFDWYDHIGVIQYAGYLD